MKTSTIEIEISVPVQKVWQAISTTEGMQAWRGSLKVESDWQVSHPIIITCYDDKGVVLEYNGEKMIFNGIIEVKNDNKEITCSYPEKVGGIEKESYLLKEIDSNTTHVTFVQTCTTEEKAKDMYGGMKQIMETLKKVLELK